MKIISSVFLLGLCINLSAQTELNLTLNHNYNGEPFSYGENFETTDGDAVTFTRVQYYLCGFEITHDEGQTLALEDLYILASGNISNYELPASEIQNLEAFNFNLGVDYDANHMGLTSWPTGHALAAQSPSMDWGWPSGYFFFVIDGKVDDNGDGTPNKTFELRGLGDDLFREVNQLSGINLSGSNIDININVNIADWVLGLDLASVGFDHSGSANNVAVANNTNDETVFTYGSTSGLNLLENKENSIYANYEFPYAPTIFYSLATNSPVDVSVIDMSGALVIEKSAQPIEGNFFVDIELPSGAYIISFDNRSFSEQYKFIIQN